MRDYRMAAGASLTGKIEEIGFFLSKILKTLDAIEARLTAKDLPINDSINELNFFFSAFLNAVQSLKDCCQISMAISIKWEEFSPTYGPFIYYCRNATTHDGSHVINAVKGHQSYIAGPLRRIDSHGKVKEFDPPKEDVRTLIGNIGREIISSARGFLAQNGSEIPTPGEPELQRGLLAAISHDFIPEPVREMIKANQQAILSSAQGMKVDFVGQALEALSQIESHLPQTGT